MIDLHKLNHPFVEQILRAQHVSIETHGGDHGVRDLGLLMSALATPKQSFGGEMLHPGVAEMAAAYLFHLCMNHAFVDGNKRIGLMAAILFLKLNKHRLVAPLAETEAMTLRVASSQCSKGELTEWFKIHVRRV